jgi:holin-like protein
VLGLVMLLAWFIRTGGPDAEMHHTATGLLKYLGLLFVPAGVGVVSELTPLRQNAGAILLAIPLSTIIALLVTGTLMSLFLRNQPRA